MTEILLRALSELAPAAVIVGMSPLVGAALKGA